jgi:protein N-terminal methyltransferase
VPFRSIGRITEGLLLPLADKVDVIEPMQKFTAVLEGKQGVRQIFNIGLEEWVPTEQDGKYDIVWVQWCIGHLNDAQLVAFLQQCQRALADDGFIVLKENMSTGDGDLFDEDDSSVTRYVDKALSIWRYVVLTDYYIDRMANFEASLSKQVYASSRRSFRKASPVTCSSLFFL